MISNSGLKKSACCSLPSWIKKSDAPYIEILTNIDHLSQANYILEQMGYQPKQPEDTQLKKSADPCPTRIILAKAKEWLDAGDDFDQ